MMKNEYDSNTIIQLGEKYNHNPEGFLEALSSFLGAAPLDIQAQLYSQIGIDLYSFRYFNLAIAALNTASECYSRSNDKQGMSMCYGNMGIVYQGLGDLNSAIDSIKKSLEIKLEIGDEAEEAGCYTNLGSVYAELGNYEEAIKYLRKSLEINLKLDNKLGLAESYTNLGGIYHQLNDFNKSVEAYQESITIDEELGTGKEKWISYKGLGASYHSAGNLIESIKHYEKAISICEEYGDKENALICYSELGQVYENLAVKNTNAMELNNAIQYYEKSLHIAHHTNDKVSLARLYSKMGLAYIAFIELDPVKSIDCFQKALDIIKVYSDDETEINCYMGLGKSYSALGKYPDAIDYLEKALKICKENNAFSIDTGSCYEYLGIVYWRLGEFQSAFDYYQRSLSIMSELKERTQEAACYNDIGILYESMGDTHEAVKYFEKILDIDLDHDTNNFLFSRFYLNLGICYSKLEEWQKADNYLNQCLNICAESDDRTRSACYMTLGNIYARTDRNNEALKWYQEATKLKIKTGDKVGESISYSNIGNVYSILGDFQKGIEYYNKSLGISLVTGNKDLQSSVHRNLASYYYSKESYREALEHAKESIRLVGLMKETVVQEDLALSLLKSKISEYHLGINAAIRLYEESQNQDYLKEAIEILERTKSREQMKKYGAEKRQTRVSDKNYQDLEEVESQITLLENRLRTSSSQEEVQQLNDFYSRKANLTKKIYLNGLEPSSLIPIVDLKLLDLFWKGLSEYRDDATVLEMYIQDSKIRFFFFNRDRYQYFETPLTEDLANLSNEYIARENGYKMTGRMILNRFYSALEELIIRLLPRELKENLRHLTCQDLFVIPHRWLHRIAWEAVILDDIPLGVKFNLVRGYNLDSLRFSFTHKNRGNNRALIISDPRSDLGNQETALVETQLTKMNHQVEVLEKESATLANVLEKLPDASSIHFDCHARFNLEDPLTSEILLNDQSLLAGDIIMMNLENSPFIFLNTCESGQSIAEDSIEKILGDEQRGFVSSFMAAKASSVLATQWRVDVGLANKFSECFYKELSRNELGEALRIARGEEYHGSKSISRDWATYMLYGNPYVQI